MKVLLLNSVCGVRSTGRICTEIADKLIAEGHEVKIAYGRLDAPEKYRGISERFASTSGFLFHVLRTFLTGGCGFGSKADTRRFLAMAEEFDPDMIWLHNIHGYYINIEMLFDWIKKRPQMQVKWTLHDCWSFTGHCAYFSMAGCDRWQSGCGKCPQRFNYPFSLLCDRTRKSFARKKAAFTGVKNMTLITPSHWLADLVRLGFLRDYPIEVVYNTINTEIFKPTPGDFRQKRGLENKRLILGVASIWEKRKGLADLLKLRELLDDRYAIVLVGLNAKQIKALPKGILGIQRTDSAKELAEIYTAADLFVNPSREETFGLTTVEARACGTEAIVYKNTACEEIVQLQGGIAVDQSPQALLSAIEAYFEG